MPTLDEMREATKDTREGAVCSRCGVFFTGRHGHPVLCRSCWKHTEPEDREGLNRATIREM